MDEAILQRRLSRAKAEIHGLERLLESKTRDLYLSREALKHAVNFQDNVLRTMRSALVVIDHHGQILQLNEMARTMLGRDGRGLLGHNIREVVCLPEGMDDEGADLHFEQEELEVRLVDGSIAPTLFSSSAMSGADGEVEGYVCVWIDLRDQKRMELELRQAQKLESLGQMAAGVAHEINTPIQFVGDSLRFLLEAFEDLLGVLGEYRQARLTCGEDSQMAALAERLARAEEDADVEFIEEEAPGAFERAMKGLERVAVIVKALKAFSHPGSDDIGDTNLNEVVQNAVTLTRNEYHYFADLDLQLGDLPMIECDGGDLGQVILNLIVNAAHAIEEKIAGTDERGRIDVRTYMAASDAVVEIRDTGGGIPEPVLARIYDPFFTTKEVGKGTGQGLSISHRIVVEKHQGRIDVETEEGVGTTFRVSIPQRQSAGRAA